MNRFDPDAFLPLDEEEQALMASLEADEWRPVANLADEKEKVTTAVRHTIKKEKRINLCLTQNAPTKT